MSWLKGFFIGYGTGLALFSLLAGIAIYILVRSGVLAV